MAKDNFYDLLLALLIFLIIFWETAFRDLEGWSRRSLIRDSLSLTLVFSEFGALLSVKRNRNEFYINYESKFVAEGGRYISDGK